jgi:hypothetical protein
MALAAMAKSSDPLDRIVKMAWIEFADIPDKLKKENILLRRKTEPTGYVITLTITLVLISLRTSRHAIQGFRLNEHVEGLFEKVCLIVLLCHTDSERGAHVMETVPIRISIVGGGNHLNI